MNTYTTDEVIAIINERGVVYTHFEGDFQNIFTLEALRHGGCVFEVKRCPVGQAPDGEIWIDVFGRNPDTALLILDADYAGEDNMLDLMVWIGFYVPEHAVEVAEMMFRPKATNYRSALSFLRYMHPQAAWALAENGMLLDSLDYGMVRAFRIEEAYVKQRGIVQTAIENLKRFEINSDVVVATETITDGRLIAFELEYTILVECTVHEKGGVIFAINSSKELSLAVVAFAQRYGAYVPPHGKMAVLGGVNDPEGRLPIATVESFSSKLRELLG